MNKTSFVYTTYIATTPEKLWQALTNSEFTKQYFFGREIISDWQVGSSFKLMNKDKVDHYGEVLVCVPYSLLAVTWSWREVIEVYTALGADLMHCKYRSPREHDHPFDA